MATPVSMEQQILKIVACPQPYEVKRTLIQYCCKMSVQPMENDACHAILKLAIQWILEGSETLLVESGRMMLMSWAQNKTTALVSFFDDALLLSLLEQENIQTSCLLDILTCVFPYLQSSSKIYPHLCEILGRYITTWLRLNDTVEYCGRLAEFLMAYADCLPSEKEELLQINLLLVQSLGKTIIPNATKDEMIEYFKKTSLVCEFLAMIWRKDTSQSFVVLSVKECFEILAKSDFPSTVALANLTSYIPDDVINPLIYEVTMSPNIPVQELSAGISKMVQWLVWPKKTRVHQWLLTFFKCLVKAGKRKVLESIIVAKILQVFSRVFMPVIRESNFVVLVNMLLYFTHSPEAFHMIVPFVPNLMDRLRSERTEKSSNYLYALGELMYTLMHRFPDDKDLYKPMLLSLKDIPRPSYEAMNKWLQSVIDVPFTSDEDKTTAPRLNTPEMVTSVKGTRKTGLVNLGNTCYMNSILQCLFMLDVFRCKLMLRHATPTHHPIMYSLQDVFTFLIYSMRDAVAPECFVRQSRPPWFPTRTQQDCCEFVQYMMDRLEEEDKSLKKDERQPSNTTNIIEENFKGTLCVTYRCLRCGNESQHREAFTDILLAFPDKYCVDVDISGDSNSTRTDKPPSDETHCENPKSLKGGDQIRKFQEPRTPKVFSGELFESTNESVSNVETSSKTTTQKKSSTDSLTKRGTERFTYTIHEMLDYFMKPEKLSGNNQYFCDECRESVDGERHVEIGELPKYLMLALKRFSFDIKSQTKPKLLHIVQYPEELNFSSTGESIKLARRDSEDVVDSACKKSELGEYDVAMKEEWDDWAMDTSKSLYSYSLCSVVVHSGRSCEAGHYYSYALDTQGKDHVGSKAPQWYCFNDEYVKETSYKEFMEREKNLSTDTTYILIYEQVRRIGQDDGNVNCEFTPPQEMIERVKQDNVKYFQDKQHLATTSQRKGNTRTQFDDDDKDDSSPPGNCGSSGSNFSVPGNRFIF